MARTSGGFSQRTRTAVPRSPIRDVDDLYPDRAATPTSGGGNQIGVYPKKDTGTTQRLSEDVPKTTRDMSKLFTWQSGEEVLGDHAKAHIGMKNYIKDIEGAIGDEGYKHIFIDTFRPLEPQITKIKKKRI